MRILVVDPDRKFADYVSRGLEEKGYVVDVVSRGEEAVRMVCDYQYDLAILEVVLPGIDGFAMLERMQEDCVRKFQQMKVMYLSSKDTVENRVRGLTLGADDFVGKPFSFSELLARVQALLRRGPLEEHSHPVHPNRFCVSDLCVDFDKQQAWRNHQPLNLTAREFALLAVLARRPGKVFTRAVLEELVWKDAHESEANIVDAAIRRLRRKVDEPYPNRLIHTRRGLGYVLEDAPENHLKDAG